VSEFLKQETRRVVGFDGDMEVIHNFFEPRAPQQCILPAPVSHQASVESLK
jgi:hypothetical protein